MSLPNEFGQMSFANEFLPNEVLPNELKWKSTTIVKAVVP